MFNDHLALQIADAAKASGISEVGMLAICEVETAGHPFEADGRTPNFLFERHIFQRELTARAPDKLKQAQAAGLAIPKWDKATQYRDERTSSERMDLLDRAKAVDPDCALRSCSWGLPQIMGNECEEVGFDSATTMVNFMIANGVGGHIALMVKFLKARKLESAIERGDWDYVALRYNGRGYKKNQYDTRLAAAAQKWTRKLPALRDVGGQDYPEESLTPEQIKHIQLQLRDLGYHEVGEPDGKWGDLTSGAIFNFQKQHGLPPTGHFDEETAKVLEGDPLPRPVSETRANTTEEDLRKKGSRTIIRADQAGLWGKIKVILGSFLGGGTILDSSLNGAQDTINKANDAVDKVHQVKDLAHSMRDLVPLDNAHAYFFAIAIFVVVGGYLIVRYAARIKQARVEDHQSGVHAGIARD